MLCKVVLVFDGETLDSLTEDNELKLPDAWRKQLYQNPGLLFALVVVPSGRTYFLPFKDPADVIFSVYGNSVQLEGRNGKIECKNMDIENGEIVLQRKFSEAVGNLVSSTNVADIGSIFGT